MTAAARLRPSAPLAPSRSPTAGDEHEFEAAPGLPEPLPPGERLLWQGAPSFGRLARTAFHARELALYFAVILALRAATVAGQGGTAAEALAAVAWLVPAALFALGLVALIAWLSARTTLYTITDRRVVMRIGIVLTVTFNLPFKRIEAAAVATQPSGFGDIALTLAPGDRIAWLQLWPHARPWTVRRPEPSLRSIADAARVGALLAQAWQAVREQPTVDPVADPQAGQAPRPSRRPGPALTLVASSPTAAGAPNAAADDARPPERPSSSRGRPRASPSFARAARRIERTDAQRGRGGTPS